MPKIKDLGINTIPITMQPPEIGGGGGGDLGRCEHRRSALGGEQTACSESTCGGNPNTSGCSDTTCTGNNTSGCTDTSCHDDTSACGDTSCSDYEATSCSDTTCVPHKRKSPSPRDRKAGAFSPDAIAQLRRQLESHIST